MWFHLLGPLRVFDDLQAELTLSRSTLRHLLAALLLQAGQAISPGRLAGLLWEDARDRRIPELRTLVCSLRAFPAVSQRLATVPGGYRLEVSPGELDLEQFRLLAGQGHDALSGGCYREAAGLAARSLALWDEPPLADLPQTVTIQQLAAELLEERHAARLDLAEALLALGRHRALVPRLVAQAARHPADERTREFLMLALYRSGRRADALGAFQAIARTLRDEYGIDPGPDLCQLHRDILRDRVPAAPARLGTSQRARGDHEDSLRFGCFWDSRALSPPGSEISPIGQSGNSVTLRGCRDDRQMEIPEVFGTSVRIGYARLSTYGQDQQAQLDALAAAHCREVIVETASTRDDWPKLRAVLATLQSGDTLVIYKPDRVARSMRELLVLLEDQLHARGAALHILTGTCAGLHRADGATMAGKMLFMTAAIAAEMERDLTRERILEGLRAARARGRRGGRPPAVDDNALAIARTRRERGESVTAIARHLGIGRSTLYRALSPEHAMLPCSLEASGCGGPRRTRKGR